MAEKFLNIKYIIKEVIWRTLRDAPKHKKITKIE